MEINSDLRVDSISKSLDGFHLDVLVTGSIGAVESVKFLRSLRRLSACVYPWLSKGGSLFTTEDALSWAAGGRKVMREFSGEHSHIAHHDALIVAPASSNMIAQIAGGFTSEPGTALVASYLGAKKPVILVPNMHESLYDSPFVRDNLKKISHVVTLLEPKKEEGKYKFPEPSVLADKVSYQLRHQNSSKKVLVTMGSTKGYLDDIRYVSNYSSGKLGSLVSEELYRHGCKTLVVSGSAKVYPQVYNDFKYCETNAEMEDAALSINGGHYDAAVCAASVLDFEPTKKIEGKIKSIDHEFLRFDMKRVHKIIKNIKPRANIKIGFKLDSDFTDMKRCAHEYMNEYQLSMMVFNKMNDVSISKHKATIYYQSQTQEDLLEPKLSHNKRDIANLITQHILSHKNI